MLDSRVNTLEGEHHGAKKMGLAIIASKRSYDHDHDYTCVEEEHEVSF